MVKVCATSDILAQRFCLINEQTLIVWRALRILIIVGSVTIAAKYRQ